MTATVAAPQGNQFGVNPGWHSFGDFASDAGLGIVIFLLIPLAIAALTWWITRSGGDR